jgi:uncharacterized membrane protein YebE (DUF533 family)
MYEFNQINESLEKGKLKSGQIEELKNLFQTALADGRLTTKEMAQIQFYYYESDLSEKEFSALKGGVFQEVVRAALADHIVTDEENDSIFRIAKQLSISKDWQDWARSEIQKHASSPENSI